MYHKALETGAEAGIAASSPGPKTRQRELGQEWEEQVFWIGETIAMKRPSQHLIAEVPRNIAKRAVV
jgi:hypothetical protein